MICSNLNSQIHGEKNSIAITTDPVDGSMKSGTTYGQSISIEPYVDDIITLPAEDGILSRQEPENLDTIMISSTLVKG